MSRAERDKMYYRVTCKSARFVLGLLIITYDSGKNYEINSLFVNQGMIKVAKVAMVVS